MARSLAGFLALFPFVLICGAASLFQPISDSHRSAALELFTPTHGSFKSLEETYEALRTFEVLGIEKKPDVTATACRSISETLGSLTSTPKDLFYALKANSIVKCKINEKTSEFFFFFTLQKGIFTRLNAAVNGASSLLDFYYSIGGLVLIKGQTSKADVYLTDAEGVFRSVKAFSQSDGRWRYSSNNPESSAFAAGIALETLAGIVSLASSEMDQSLIITLKNDVSKLFDSIEKYDVGALYFDDKLVDGREHQGPLSTTSSVVRGLTALAAVTAGSVNLPGDKILGLAKFFLGIGVPGDAEDFFNQIDSLACLESNRVSIPLILSLPSTELSLTKKDSLKVRVNTVLGSNAPPLTVKLVGAFSSGSKDASLVESQELKFDAETGVHILSNLPKSIDVGSYTFVFEIVLHESEHVKVYVTGSQTKVPIFVTGLIKIESAEITVLDGDLGSIETQKKLDLAGHNAVSLSANHLQKLRISFQLTTPRGRAFRPHQALLKLRHESKIEHIFLVGNSGKQFEIVLNFLGLVEKFFYLSGRYDIELTVGDAVMENSLLRAIGHIELDLPEPPEKAPRPPPQPVDPYSRYGPKAEITHIFRAPEKHPPKELSLAFLGLTILPLLGFLVGLLRLGVNLKNFPSKAIPATFAILFHVGIGAVLLLYVLFWLKLDLFQTLKLLGFLGVFLVLVGHRILSHLAATSAKVKSA
ncbi:dolichyl-diphosphooligosaccharide--protein glycosyltransferase subunit 2 isoform X1 [Herrania umbratica]|uniref:Dolichyl-diphosphooligosaccharide--protein glycosyltransferase subunit 2 n=1 Tax=Herrania umbratica TaxID=108875 RepID=A0A6J0ZY72_9ROSI|nr:dolichyl-diphosphooligosaccharide--protein glycosyltransferase subunit 2 isoform X1 [Herrania umbratica]XP_021279532.1 dolichyl-diphosphooligosaccharide--protein glycosyltransferase subunit 2 isoform X1 [Herrania umbratica]